LVAIDISLPFWANQLCEKNRISCPIELAYRLRVEVKFTKD